jgi:general secretion pathway protein M
MNTRSQKASQATRAALAGWGQRFDAFWSARNARERKLLGIGSLVVIGGLLYGLLLDPAVSGRAQMQKQLPALREQAAQTQALAREVDALKKKTLPEAPLLTRENVESALASKGLKVQSLAVTGEQVRAQFENVSFSAIVDWLQDMHRGMNASVVEASVQSQSQSHSAVDMVNATLLLRQQRREQGSQQPESQRQ